MTIRERLLGSEFIQPNWDTGDGGGGAPSGDGGGDAPPAGDAPPPAGDAPAGDAGPSGDEPKGDAGGKDDPPADPPVTPHKPDWRDRQLAKKNEKIKELETKAERVERLERELAELRARAEATSGGAGGGQPHGEQPPAPTGDAPQRHQFRSEAEFQQAVKEEATRLAKDEAAKTVFMQQFDGMVAAGKTQFKDNWDKAVANLHQMGDLDGADVQRILAATDGLDTAARVIYTLGAQPEQYERIMALDPIKQVAEFTKLGLAAKAPAPKKPSDAPAPIEPIGSRNSKDNVSLTGTDADGDLNKSTAEAEREWYRRRAEQKKAATNRPWGRRGAA